MNRPSDVRPYFMIDNNVYFSLNLGLQWIILRQHPVEE